MKNLIAILLVALAPALASQSGGSAGSPPPGNVGGHPKITVRPGGVYITMGRIVRNTGSTNVCVTPLFNPTGVCVTVPGGGSVSVDGLTPNDQVWLGNGCTASLSGNGFSVNAGGGCSVSVNNGPLGPSVAVVHPGGITYVPTGSSDVVRT